MLLVSSVGNVSQAQDESDVPTVPPVAVPAPTTGPYSIIDKTRIRGLNLPFPGAENTVDQTLGGIRTSLAEQGIGYLFFTNTFFADNLIRHGLPAGDTRGNQVYLGQLATTTSANFAFATYDLSRYGVPDGQIVAGGSYYQTNWNPFGPRTTSLNTLSYYQTLFDKRVEVKAGEFPNAFEYLGTFVGGSISGGVFGPNGAITTEQGENSPATSTPGINVRVNLPDHLYNKAGVQRAISPDGNVIEHNQDASGVRFKVPNAGALYIDEFGYDVPPAPGQMRTWVRAAATYTSSNYVDFSLPNYPRRMQRSEGNHGLFLLADRQLIQTAPGVSTSQRGLYAGFSVFYAPPALNRFSQYYEARLYGFGLIPTRPLDQMNLVYNTSVFSSELVSLVRRQGGLAHSTTQTVTASYSAHVYPGVNLNLGLAYTDHPTAIAYTGSTGSALNILLGTVTFF